LKSLREYVVKLVSDMEFLAVAPLAESYYRKNLEEGVMVSNWSERHVAYAAGLGTFSLTGALITERGMAVRCDSVVTDLALPSSPRTARDPFSNCLFYVNGSCKVCVQRCPSGAVSAKGLNKKICLDYINIDLVPLREVYGVEKTGCGLCQTGVPCEFRNPVSNKGKTVNQKRIVNVQHA
jgi:epoxyqueuosine reductase QueG